MRLILCILMILNLGVVKAYAKYEQSGWFVADKSLAEEEMEDISELDGKNLANQEESNNKENVEVEIIDRFTTEDKDLKLADVWLKKEFELVKDKNFAVSPLSLYTVSTLIANGVIEDTFVDIVKIFEPMRLPVATQRLRSYFNEKKEAIKAHNSLWGETFSSRYQKLMKTAFQLELWRLEKDTSVIDEWLASKNEGISLNVVEKNKVKSGELYFANITSVSSNWNNPFNIENIVEQVFYDINGNENTILMMNRFQIADYYEDDFMQAIRLGYNDKNFITFFLPRKNVEFKDFIAGLDAQKLNPVFKREFINIVLPQFDVVYASPSFKDLYGELGISKIFNPSYDYAKMVSYDVNSYVSDAILTTKISINDGRDAGSKNAKKDGDKSNSRVLTNRAFQANRPFVFMVNYGDIVGAYLSVGQSEIKRLEMRKKQRVSTVEIKERKNGTPAWYENKTEQGNFVLKSQVVDKKAD